MEKKHEVAIEILELCAGMVKIVESVETAEEMARDGRIVEYHGLIVALIANNKDAFDFLAQGFRGFEALNNTIEAITLGARREHNCDECAEAGNCPIEDTMRSRKKADN